MSYEALSRRSVLAGVAASVVLGRGAADARGGEERPDAGLWRDIELLDADDRRFRVDEIEKPFTLIKLWAHWCPSCLSDLSSLPGAAPALRERNVDVVLVSNPSDWTRDQMTARARNIPFRTARPSPSNGIGPIRSALFSADGMYYVPRSLLFCRSRQAVVWQHLGGLDWRSPDTLTEMKL